MTGGKQAGPDGGKNPPSALTEERVREIVQEQWTAIEQQVMKSVADEVRKDEYRKERQKIDLAWLASSSQWLIASLLAVNSAGAIAVGEKISPGTGLWLPIALFVVGAIAALFAGLFYRQAARWSVSEHIVHHKREDSQVGKLALGIFPRRGTVQDPKEAENFSRNFSTLSIVASWISFAIFVSGIVMCALLFGQMYSRQLTQYSCQFDANGVWNCTTEG